MTILKIQIGTLNPSEREVFDSRISTKQPLLETSNLYSFSYYTTTKSKDLNEKLLLSNLILVGNNHKTLSEFLMRQEEWCCVSG